MGTPLEWAIFAVIVLGMLALDLLVFHKRAHAVSMREAAGWSVVWVTLALLFGVFVWVEHGPDPALDYLTAWIVEKSLSVDNLFVFLAIFAHFGIRNEDQHRVLFWGVLGALVMRMIFIAAGAALLDRFSWMIFVFGGFLVYTGVMMGIGKKGDVDPESSRLLRFAVRHLRTTKELHGQKFLIREKGALVATPLLLVLVLVELSDVLFAFDSVPAVLGITTDLFIVYTSNVFAILGLRALYFLLTGAVARLQYLDKGLALVLAFIGGKMVVSPWVHIPVLASLAVVFAILGATVAASLMSKPPPAAAG